MQLKDGDEHQQDTTDDALAAFGLRAVYRPEADGETFWLWPCNVSSLELWFRVQTQWRVGMAGATGLDYSGVESTLRLSAVPRKDWPRQFGDVQAMESAWLQEILKRRK